MDGPLVFQSTLPRRERRRSGSGSEGVVPISIHAPAKGATVGRLQPEDRRPISIHAPAKGATFLLSLLDGFAEHFNPRSREGSDSGGSRVLISCVNFNPRSREGSDDVKQILSHKHTIFQSTLPRRERPVDDAKKDLYIYWISIHAPAKGATILQASCNIPTIFQSTLPRRERQQKSPRLSR